jgi:DNA-binding GntR family transcriptional regulator
LRTMSERLPLPSGPLHPQGVLPVSAVLAAAIRFSMIQNQWPVGAQLPSEPELAEWYGVSRDTVTRAYSMLVQTGAVVTKRGLGRFVARRPDFKRIEVSAGATITSRRAVTAAERAALDETGLALFTPVVIIERPGQPTEVYDATSVVIECR